MKNIYKKRHKSSIFNLRSFHNWTKSTLLTDTIKYTRDTFNNNISILDLAVGKGGDIGKWYRNNIYLAIGLDIDNDSINGKHGAIHRYRQLVNQLKRQNKRIPHYEFYVFDLSNPNNIPKIDNVITNRKFNIVSCQFAIHYMFKDSTSLDTFINIAAKNIANNGFFIGTTLLDKHILSLLDNKYKISNDTFTIENKTFKDKLNNPYGRTYTVSLGKIDKTETHYFVKQASTEYMVDLEELKKVCNKYDLVFIGIKHFEEWYEKYLETNPRYKLSENEKKFSFLNFSFVFQKIVQ